MHDVINLGGGLHALSTLW